MRNENIRCIRKYRKKNGSISYHAEVRRKQATPIRKSFSTLTAAKNWVRTTETRILEGDMIESEKKQQYRINELIKRHESLNEYIQNKLKQLEVSKTTTLNDLIDIYIEKNLDNLRKKDKLSHLQWWRKYYGDKYLIDMTPYIISEAKHKLIQEKNKNGILRNKATANRYLATLSTIFTLAYKEWELISENPFLKVSKFPENKGRTRFLTKEELQLLLEECKKSSNTNLYGMVLLAGTLGMRFGEIANLTWKDIDFKNRFITLEMTKNKDTRVVPMPDSIYHYLQAKNHKRNPEEFVFPSKDPSKRSPYSMIRKSFHRILQKLKFEDVVFHTLRHTAASHLAMNGATQGELMEILGHRSPMMSKRYTHFNKEHLLKLIKKNELKINIKDFIGNYKENPFSNNKGNYKESPAAQDRIFEAMWRKTGVYTYFGLNREQMIQIEKEGYIMPEEIGE